MEPAVVLVTGSDPILVGDAVRAAVDRAVGGGDRTEIVHELAGEDYEAAAVVDAANTPPFFADRRVVVARGIERFDGGDVALLTTYLADPLDTTVLVLEWAGGRVPKPLTDAVSGAGGERVASDAPGGRARKPWLQERFDAAPINLDRTARARIEDHVGQDLGRLGAILETLTSVHGEGATLALPDVEPYLSDAGSIPPWELTDPIDQGDVAGALAALERLIDAGGMHPLQLMAILHRHVAQALRLDGAGAADEAAAAKVLGLRGSTFPAKKALERTRRWQREGIAEGLALLAAADLDLRGRTDLPDRTVMEVLVARLARRLGRR